MNKLIKMVTLCVVLGYLHRNERAHSFVGNLVVSVFGYGLATFVMLP